MNKFIYITVTVAAILTQSYLFLLAVPFLWYVFREETPKRKKIDFRRNYTYKAR